MTDEQAMLAAIHAHPREDTPRLMYSDWLEENGRPEQAEFIRKHRVGEAVGKIRDLAHNRSRKRQADLVGQRAENPVAILNNAVNAARKGDSVKAAGLHDLAAEHYLRNAFTYDARDGTPIMAAGNRYRALANYHAAQHHEAAVRDLGSPANLASERAYTRYERMTTGRFNDAEDLVAIHQQAAEDHYKAAELHDKEGNEDTAHRHRIVAGLHQALATYHTARYNYPD